MGIELNELESFFDTVPESRKWTIVADSSRPETISYLHQLNFCIEGEKRAKEAWKMGFSFLGDLKKLSFTLDVKGRHSDFENYRWKKRSNHQ